MIYNYLNFIKHEDYLIFILIVAFTIIFIDRSNISIKGTLSIFIGIFIFYIYISYKYEKVEDEKDNIEEIIKKKPKLKTLENHHDILHFYNYYKYLEQYDPSNFNESIKNASAFYTVYERIMKNSSLKYYQFDVLENHKRMCIENFMNIQFNIPNQKLVMAALKKCIIELNLILNKKYQEVTSFLKNDKNLNIYSKIDFDNKVKPYNSFKNMSINKY